MIQSTVLEQVTAIVRRAGRVAPGVAITAESRLVEDLAIDSLDVVDVVLKIQDQFDIAIDDEDVPNLHSVSDLANYVATHLGNAAA